MNELEAQKAVVDAVRADGGMSFKMAHKFFAGVPDLFVKLPDLPASMFEVKIRDEPTSTQFTVPLSKMQHVFLRDYEKVRGFAGIISFVRGKKDLLMLALPYSVLVYHDADVKSCQVALATHVPVSRGHRNKIIVETLRNAYRTEAVYQPQRFGGDQEG